MLRLTPKRLYFEQRAILPTNYRVTRLRKCRPTPLIGKPDRGSTYNHVIVKRLNMDGKAEVEFAFNQGSDQELFNQANVWVEKYELPNIPPKAEISLTCFATDKKTWSSKRHRADRDSEFLPWTAEFVI